MKYVETLDKAKCTGCSSCQNCCPVGAISMKQDAEGFLFPSIDQTKCVDCGKCINCCPVITAPKIYGNSLDNATAYAAWSLDSQNRERSSSGGIFGELAKYVYEQGGVVVGAVFDDNFIVKHYCSESIDELDRLRRSKYSQSDIGFVFKEIKQFLKNERLVLFCGTGCQCAGLRSYLIDVPENLLLCDFICHGVNSPKAFDLYLKMMEQKFQSKVTFLNFRDKRFGWSGYQHQVCFENGQEYVEPNGQNIFMKAFLKHLMVRKSCCNCLYKEGFRSSDIMFGDFWGIRNQLPELDDDNGISAIIASTEKGRKILSLISDKIKIRDVSVCQILAGNPSLRKSCSVGKNRDKFLKNMERLGFEKAFKKYGKKTAREKVINLCRRLVRKIKKILGK